MEIKHNIRLTSAEIANLWNSYMMDSMGICVLKYFLQKIEDTQMKPVVQYALDLSQKHIQTLTKLFKSEDFPIPKGFTDEDVNVNAPRLYSDIFILQYIKHMARIGTTTSSMALYLSARSDVREYYSECTASYVEMDNIASNVLLNKGLFVRPANICPPKNVDFVTKQDFLSGWLGKRRPLTAMEITNLFLNIETNSLGKAVIMGFGQVAHSEEVRSYFVRGKEISTKQIEVCSGILRDADLPTPVIWDSEVTDSTTAPFSDKLMMFHTISLISLAIADFGLSISTSPRKDLTAHYHRLMAEIELYAEDGANLMIKQGWMEQPPRSVDRNELVKR